MGKLQWVKYLLGEVCSMFEQSGQPWSFWPPVLHQPTPCLSSPFISFSFWLLQWVMDQQQWLAQTRQPDGVQPSQNSADKLLTEFCISIAGIIRWTRRPAMATVTRGSETVNFKFKQFVEATY